MIYVLVVISLTLLVLIIGLVVMAVGGKLNRKFSTKLMSLRVAFQALAIAMLAIAYFLSKNLHNS